ncbi:MAG: transglycosylase domain-containing protein [Bacteroidales bacterium]|nr:transglycosylase domain-containing protein [Bacteroidales bacterium]
MAEEKKEENIKTKKRSYLKYLLIFWFAFILSIGGLSYFFYAIIEGKLGYMPNFEELENPNINLASEVYSSDAKLLGKYYRENRSTCDYAELSPYLVNALTATEDIRFREHSGIDGKALFRVIYGVVTGSHKGGGSTITQQLAKNLFPRGERLSKPELIVRKFKEWVTATKLERHYSKDEIISMYFNTVDFGHQSWGVKAAARTFFNKAPSELNVEEAALLVGIVNAPSRYSPIRNPERATERRNRVLHQMNKYDFLQQQQYDSLKQLPLDVSSYKILSHKAGLAKHFREYIRSWLGNWAQTHTKPNGETYDIYKDGLRIYTTIDSRLQQYAEEAVEKHIGLDLQPAFERHWKGYSNAPFVFDEEVANDEIKKLIAQGMKRSERYRKLRLSKTPMDSIVLSFKTATEMQIFTWNGTADTIMTPMDSIRYYKSILQSGLMSMDPLTGYVKAYVGNIDYGDFKYDHVTQAKRQVGSTFKPILYTLAMESGEYSPCTTVPNVQVSIPQVTGDLWTPRNTSDYKKGEMISLKEALAHSNNWISAYLIKRFSPLSVSKLAKKMGITSNIPAVHAISLGAADISLYEMVGAMSTFANKGIYTKPTFITRIEDKNGVTLERFIPETQEAMSEETAYLMLDLMKGVTQHGTGIRLRYKYKFDNPIAGKTGTTQNQSDGWFMGITPDLVTGIWVGCEDRAAHFRTITLGQGANMALPVWALYMQQVYADSTINISKGDFEKPIRPLSVEIDCDRWQNQSKPNNVVIDESEF